MKRFHLVLLVGLLLLCCAVTADAQICCEGRVGDANGQGGDEPTVGDITTLVLIRYIYGGMLPPDWQDDFCALEADVNQSGGTNPTVEDITITDISMLIDYLYIHGPHDPVHNPDGVVLPPCPGQSGNPHGYMVAMGSCKGGSALSSPSAPVSTCMTYNYDGAGTLALTHVNAGLNCCPNPTLTVTVSGNVITITETDENLCRCLCLYDIQYKIENLPDGQYRIVVNEAIDGGGAPLEFTAVFDNPVSGEYCVARNVYPWSDDVGGMVTAHSGCLQHNGAALSAVPRNQSCLSYSYDGSGVLSITRSNAAFNCCVDNLAVAVEHDGNTVTITEYDVLSNPCTCLCLYDFEYAVLNLPPGEYDFEIVEKYVSSGPSLNFSIDLSGAPTGDLCVTRDFYPWGE